MLVSPAFAQDAAAAAQAPNLLVQLLPLVLIFVVFFFLIIRPQQKKAKQHREMLQALRRGDRIVTAGGIIGVISKVESDAELTVEIAANVKVKVLRETVANVLAKTEPAKGDAAKTDAASDDSAAS